MKKTVDGECEINFTNMSQQEFDDLRILLFTLSGNTLNEDLRKQLSLETLMDINNWKTPEVVSLNEDKK